MKRFVTLLFGLGLVGSLAASGALAQTPAPAPAAQPQTDFSKVEITTQ